MIVSVQRYIWAVRTLELQIIAQMYVTSFQSAETINYTRNYNIFTRRVLSGCFLFTLNDLSAQQLLVPAYSFLRVCKDYEIRNPLAHAHIFDVSDTIINYRIASLRRQHSIKISSEDIYIWEEQKKGLEQKIREDEYYFDLDMEMPPGAS